MANLTAFSLWSLLVIAGVYFYTGGGLVPVTQGADAAEVTGLWITWGAIVALPLITAALWAIRLASRNRE